MTEAKLAPNLPKWMVDHTNLYLSSGGKEGHMYTINQPDRPSLSVPSLLLTTTGRKSGQKYLFPLFYGKAGNSYYIVASKGGAPTNPDWFYNLIANPIVTVERGTETFQARAVVPEAAERDRLFDQVSAQMPGFAEYQRNTTRKIPVVVLEKLA